MASGCDLRAVAALFGLMPSAPTSSIATIDPVLCTSPMIGCDELSDSAGPTSLCRCRSSVEKSL